MTRLAELLEDEIDGEPDLEEELLGTGSTVEIEGQLTAILAPGLAPVADGLFYRRGVGMVIGIRLVDGREVVVKLHRQHVTVERLTAVQVVQDHLARSGLPVPRPLLAPTRLGAAVATVEELRVANAADGHQPEVRRTLAAGLRRFVVAALPLRGLDALGRTMLLAPGSTLWPEPHELRFDFEATSDGAEWIDELAAQARGRLEGLDDGPVVGHFDWRVENLAFAEGGEIAAIYDWDSVALSPEAYLVGHTAASFSVDYQRGRELPDRSEAIDFVRDYEAARGRPFNTTERDIIDAAHGLQCAYGARCQHSDAVLGAIEGASFEGGWIARLRERAECPLAW